MKHGDFTKLAKDYIHRPGYGLRVLRAIAADVGAGRPGFTFADVGAGTGKLTNDLLAIGLRGLAVEPNDAMRAEGIRTCADAERVQWRAGSAEATGLPDACADWVLMGSSFHWTDAPVALAEFARVLRPGGVFTAIWNPRDLQSSELHARIEARIEAIVPGLKRVSSGGAAYTKDLERTLLAGPFHELLFLEAPHQERMTPERYLGVWRSVNDIQVQAGPERFEAIMRAIEEEIGNLDVVLVPYRIRAWTVRRKD
jgi:ubiquinone/menaquinone biosynthesis C-methylase UbiE